MCAYACAESHGLNHRCPLILVTNDVHAVLLGHAHTNSLSLSLCLWPWHSLYNNNIGDEGARMLGAGLAQCPQFKEL
jgi:hypothetical protein